MSWMFHKIERLIRCARRLRGNTDADRKLLDAMEVAAKSSLNRLYALEAFRGLMRRLVMEIDGHLFEFMLLWFLGGLALSKTERPPMDAKTRKQMTTFKLKPFNEQVDEVVHGSSLITAARKILQSDFFIKPQNQERYTAYKQLVDENQERLKQPRFKSILRELAELEEDKSRFPSLPLDYIQVKLPNPELGDMLELAKVLDNDQNALTMLCRPKRLLTHLENFQLALCHARLWLLRSELPVCFGSTVSYKNLRLGAFEPLVLDKAGEPLPSYTEVNHMQATVNAHSMLKSTEEVYHMKLEDYLPSSRWNRPGYPVIIPRGKKEKSQFFLVWRTGLEEDEDVKSTVRVFEGQEIPRVNAQLRKFNTKSFAEYGIESS